MRFFVSTLLFCAASCAFSQQPAQSTASLPEDPSQFLVAANASAESIGYSTSAPISDPTEYSLYPAGYEPHDTEQDAAQAAKDSDKPRSQPAKALPLDANGNPIPLDRQQPQRILGFMPNFRSVAGGSKPHPPGWKYNFQIATHQSFDYSSFIFLGITSLAAQGMDSHPALGKGIPGFYAYTWRGFLDKTDGTYLGAWLLPSLLHEDTRYYALGKGHSVPTRALYVISRQAVTRTYGGSQTPNIAGLGGKVLTQVISRSYYPAGSSTFSVLATKFGYSAMRDIAFSSIREFYPDIAAHYIRKHREKVAAMAAHDATTSGVQPATTP
ncbi:hypothetical protein BH10ACI4_BH10ACI4_37810 [soil metagenome]